MSEKNEWKPIESAPKDGSEFLACYTRQGNVTQIVKWNTLHGHFASKGEWLPGFTANATHWMPLPAAPGSTSSAPGDAQDEPVPEWAACESRRPWVTNSLKANAQELRDKEKRCRRAFNKDFMGVPSRYVADAYAEAAAVFEAKLVALAAQVPQQGEA